MRLFPTIRLGLTFVLVVGAARAEPPLSKSLRVASVQFRSGRDLDANARGIARRIHEAAGRGARVVAFPECALTGYFEDAVKAATAEDLARAESVVADACHEAGAYAIVGTPFRQGDALYNSAVVFDPGGRVVERYHKVQLAENWPTPGDHLSIFPIDGVPCSILICHDERYPELVRLPVLAGARVVFYLSHESGVRQESKIGPYRAQIQARAVENQVWIVHANAPANLDTTGSHGQSRIIAPDGNLVHEAGVFTEETLVADLDLARATAANARNSVARGPLGDWWREGIKRVRIVEAPTPAPHQTPGHSR
ncbi:MAG: carbon-nitrogen hydrolase family protein [Isosphaeraceae bacterium]